MKFAVPILVIVFLVEIASAQVPQPQTAQEMQAQLDLSAERIGAYISANCNPESANFTIYDTVNATIGNLTYIQVGPVNYGYYLFGNKSSDLPPLVMIPGWTGTIANWPVPLLQQLAATRQVLIFDNRGIGFSTDSAPASELTMESMAASTVDLIAALKLKKPDIFGWSMGGEIGLTMAVLFPDKIGKIMSLGGDLGGPTDLAEDAPQYGPVMAALSSSNSSDAAQMMRMSALFPAWLNDTDLPGMGACNLIAQSVQNQGVAEAIFGNVTTIYDRAANITNPVLILNGEEDVSMAPEGAVMMFNQIPGSVLVEFPEGGHGSLFSYSTNGDDSFAQMLNDHRFLLPLLLLL